jgi:uncharacterized repeat protein (TIGR01451 family)
MTSRDMAHDTARLGLVAMVLGVAGCSIGTRPVAKMTTDPFLNTEPPEIAAAERAPLAAPKLRAAARPKSAVQQTGSEIETISAARPIDEAIERVGGEIRLPDDSVCPCPCPGPNGEVSACAPAMPYPDEYLCDGGDRDLPISYSDDKMQGLETEDAAVEYRDDLGQRHVKPTTRVCVYAPRFASISSISEPIEDVGGGRPVQAVAALVGIGLDNREGTFAHHQRDATERLVTRDRGSDVTNDATAEAVEQPLPPQGHVHTAVIAQEFSFLRTGQVQQADEARLAASITAAIVLSRDQNPVITAKSEQGMELRSTFMQRELVGQENKGHREIRVVKLADKKIAVPGDIVTFTIRYDNIGDREIRDVVIIDNLTPRFEYVDDSAESEAAGRLEVEDNGEGSVILRWVLGEPVAGRKGGVVSFRALVR